MVCEGKDFIPTRFQRNLLCNAKPDRTILTNLAPTSWSPAKTTLCVLSRTIPSPILATPLDHGLGVITSILC